MPPRVARLQVGAKHVGAVRKMGKTLKSLHIVKNNLILFWNIGITNDH